MTLYSYCLRYDDGAAPNPYWGVCTLVICKPAVRRSAKVGDWVVGIGSANSPIDNISTSVVYAMRITQRLSMQEYDNYCQDTQPEKIPDWSNFDFRRRVGDCIYDFGSPCNPQVRTSVHTEENRTTDLSGQNALLSDHFYYFGDNPIRLPDHLLPIVHPTQGHKSRANEQYAEDFVKWIEGLGCPPNHLLGEPQRKGVIISMDPDKCRSLCSKRDEEENKQDSIC